MVRRIQKYYISLSILLLVSILSLSAQETIQGKVYDAETNKVIEYANVIVKNTTNGTITNSWGEFSLVINPGDKYLQISFIGYQSKVVEISPINNYKVYLDPDSEVLNEVVVVGDNTKENPAHYILKRIRKNHKKHSLEQGKTFRYKKYDKVRFDLYDPDSTLKHLGPLKGFDEFKTRKYNKGDYTYVPTLLVEEIHQVYGENNPDKMKEVLEASNTSGFKANQSVTMYLKELYLDYNVFDNSVILFNKKFISPLSNRALLSYRYAIVDSAMFEGNRIYKIQYFPKRKRELTFEGSFWADTVKYVVHSIDLKATKGFNVNFVNDVSISQKFKQVNDKLITVVKDSLTMDFSPFKQFRFIGAEAIKVTTYYDHDLEKMTPVSFAANTDVINDKPFTRSDSDWKKIRPIGLENKDQDIYAMHESLAKDKKFRAYKKLGEVLSSGWLNLGVIDYGPYYNLIGYNQIEGLRLQAGARTYFSMNDKWRIGGYSAYGFGDKDFKFGLGFSYLISQKNRWIFSIGVRDDLEQRGVLLSQENDVYSKNFASSIFTIGDNTMLTNTTSYRMGVEMEAVKNLRFKVSTKYDFMTAVDGFNMAYLDPASGEIKNQLDDFQVQFSVIYTPDRKEIGYGVDRDYVTNWHPTIRLKYIRGVAGFVNSGFNYDKVKFLYRHPFLTGGFGKTIIITEFGKTFGTVPLQLMDVIPGNQTIVTEQNMFSLMNYYEFVSDTYATLHIDHHFNGRVMSKIPLFNRFDLRAVAGFRAVWGDILNKENYEINKSEVIYLAPSDGYFEYSAGIENIFKVLRVDAVWRGSYLNNANSNPFGVRFKIKFVF
ncbi:MAG: DUF5686 family protein [Bacteroidota bacterium]